MYFSSIFPYVVLFCFLIRGLLLDGALEGITYMFYPNVCADNVLLNVEKGWRYEYSPDARVVPFYTFVAENLGRCAGVAAGGNAGLLCLRPWLRVCYCLLLLQSQEQQLPPWCLHCLWYKLSHVCAGHSCCVCCPRLPRQRKGHEMCIQVCFNLCINIELCIKRPTTSFKSLVYKYFFVPPTTVHTMVCSLYIHLSKPVSNM